MSIIQIYQVSSVSFKIHIYLHPSIGLKFLLLTDVVIHFSTFLLIKLSLNFVVKYAQLKKLYSKFIFNSISLYMKLHFSTFKIQLKYT